MRRWALALLLAAATASAHAQVLDATLISSRWLGLSLSYPAALFSVIRPEDVPGKDRDVASVADVDELRSKDGTLEVTLAGEYNSGTFNNAAGFAEQWVKGLAEDRKGEAVSVTYRGHKGSWAVVSGIVGGKVFYLRVVARVRAGRATLRRARDIRQRRVLLSERAERGAYAIRCVGGGDERDADGGGADVLSGAAA